MKKCSGLLLTLAIVLSLVLSACKSAGSTTTPAATTTAPPATTTTARPTTTAAPTPTAPAGAPVYGGILRVGAQVSPSTLIPETQTIVQWFEQPNFDTLLKMDDKGEFQANLATDWNIAADGKSITLTLRKGVKFHDGTDFNAAAAKFNLDLRKAAKLGDYEEVTSFDVVDDNTVKANLSAFSNATLVNFRAIGGLMESPTAYQKLGKDAARFAPVGTGPFKFVKFDINQLIKYERFDGYWQQGRPYLDGFEMVIIADPTTRELAFRRGEMNAAEAIQPKALAQLEKDGFSVLGGPYATISFFMGDTANADSPFAKKGVREAIEYGTDWTTVVKAVGYGRQAAISQMASPDSYAYDPNIKGRPYDPAKAKQLLADAGYPNGFKTALLEQTTIADGTSAFQGYLKDIGIDATIDVADRGRYLTETNNGWKNKLVRRAFRNQPDWLVYTYSQMSANSIGAASWARPTGFQDLLTAALSAKDAATKKTASQKILKALYDDASVLPAWAAQNPIVYDKKANGINYYPEWGFPSKVWGPADAYLVK